MRRCAAILVWISCLSAVGAEVIPPAPNRYFNDYAHVVDSATVDRLNSKLENLEKTSSDQVVVAVYPRMQSDSSIDDYAVRVFRDWKIGQKDKNNGVLLLVFTQDRKMFIETGYGLEGALPDATCKQITEYEIKPRFKAGDYAGGLTAGVDAIIAATLHEYKGNGSTVFIQQNGGGGGNDSGVAALIVPIVFIAIFLLAFRSARRGGHGWIITSGGWGGYSGGGGGGWGGGGGGGFSGGGGSAGGGGAGSSW